MHAEATRAAANPIDQNKLFLLSFLSVRDYQLLSFHDRAIFSSSGILTHAIITTSDIKEEG
jgi:hypothetical protein